MGPMGMVGPPMGGGRPMGPPPGGRPPRHDKDGHDGPPPGGMMPPQPEDLVEEDFDLEKMEKESEEMVQMVSLNRDNAVFQKTSGGLSLTLDGQRFEDVELVETFPFTEAYAFISVRNPLNKNKEIGLIEDLDRDFDGEGAALIKEQLNMRYHMPKIERILTVKESGGYTNFTVMTDFGETQFSLRSNSTSITAISENRLIIQDAEGNRFEVADKRDLSAKDLKRLDVFL